MIIKNWVIWLCLQTGWLFSSQSVIAATQVIAWGNGASSFVLTNFSNTVVVSTYPFALKNNGSIITDSMHSVPPGLSNIVAVAFSPLTGEEGGFSLALRSDGTVVSLGYKNPTLYVFDSNVPVPDGLRNVVAIAPGLTHALVLKSDGTVVTWGYENFPTNVPAGLSNVVAIAAGDDFSLALKANGTVVGWELPGLDQSVTNIPAGLSNVVAIAAGDNNGLALTANGDVVSWWNKIIPPSNLSNVVAIACGKYYNLALKSDGTVVGWGWDYNHQTYMPPTLTNVVAISAGEYAMALIDSGPPRSPAEPLNLTLAYGTPLVLPANTSGTIGQSYQWNFNGTNLPTQTNMAFMLNSLDFTNSGIYSATVSNVFGVVTNSYIINIVPLLITIPPQSQSVYGGSTVTFSVTPSGVNLHYQWQFNGTNLDMATNTTLTLTNVLPQQAGTYSIIVTNAFAALTNSATLDVTPLAITSQPQDQSAFWSGTVTFTVGTAGNLPLYYQWQFNHTNLLAATNSTLMLTNVQFTNAGNYTVIVTNSYNSTVSSNAVLTVRPFLFDTNPASLQMTTNGFQLQVDNSAGILPVVIEASSNLTDWQPIFTNPPTAGWFQFLDSTATNSSQRFYRARQQ
jgi:Immunoglobulin domain/Regulator of chromosome condensation (RCC1) repeat